jgi:hypothetical protein
LAASAISGFHVYHQNAVEGNSSTKYFPFVMSLDVGLRFIRWIEGDESLENGQSQHLPHNDKARISHQSLRPTIHAKTALELSSRFPKPHQ